MSFSVAFVNAANLPITGTKVTKLDDAYKAELDLIIKAGIDDFSNFKLPGKYNANLEYSYASKQLAKIIAKDNIAENEKVTNILKLMGLSYRETESAKSKSYEIFAPAILSFADKLTSPQARIYAYDLLAANGAAAELNIWDYLISRLDQEPSDKIRSTIILFLTRCLSFNQNEEKHKIVQDTCKEILVSNKFGPLTQASATVLLLVHDEAFEPALNYYVTVAKNFEKYCNLWTAEEELKADWATVFGKKGLTNEIFTNEDELTMRLWIRILLKILRKLDDKTIGELRIKLLEAIKEENTDTTTFEYVPEDIYFAELDQTQQHLLKTFAEVPSFAPEILQNWNMPTDLNKFINTPMPEELVDTKRDAILESVSRFEWSDLTCRIGPAPFIPKIVRGIANRNEKIRDNAWQSMFSLLYYRGERYPATVALIPVVIQLIQCPLVEEKIRMIDWLEKVAIGSPSKFTSIERQCYNAVEEGCPVYLDFMFKGNHTSLEPYLKIIAILSRFGEFKDGLVAVVKLFENDKNPQIIRDCALLAISHLTYLRGNAQSSTNLKAALLPPLEYNLANINKASKRDLTIMAVQALALSQLYLQEKNPIPEPLLFVIFIAITNPMEPIDTPFGPINKVLNDFIVASGEIFIDAMIKKLQDTELNPAMLNNLAHHLLNSTFEDSRVTTVTVGGSAPDFFDLNISKIQVRVLSAIVDSDPFWNAPSPIPQRVMGRLHNILSLDFDPTRETLRKSVENWVNNNPK